MPMTPEAIDAGAQYLREHRDAASRTAPMEEIPKSCRPHSLADAYSMQEALNTKLTASQYGEPVGWKIGCTTSVMQTYLGIAHPCAGTLYRSTTFDSHTAINASDYFQLGLECEVAVRLAQDITEEHSVESIANTVDAAMPSIEIVEHRFTDFDKAGTPSLIADDFFSVGCILGKPIALTTLPDLAEVRGGFTIDGTAQAETGTGAEILGHPLAALNWLARHFLERGRTLRAGEVVTLGSVVKTIYPVAGNHVQAVFPGLGIVTCDIR